MTIKSLRYSHVCGQTASGARDISILAMEMKQHVAIVVNARIQKAIEEHVKERLVEQQRAKWAHLTGFRLRWAV